MSPLPPQLLARVATDPASVADLSQGGFLAGPHRPDCEPLVEHVFALGLDRVLGYWREDIEAEDPGFDVGAHLAACLAAHVAELPPGEAPETPVAYVDALDLQGLPFGGVLALATGPEGPELLGAYLGHALAVRSDVEGRGIGRRLVAERFLRDGDLPTWWEDTPAYSHAGLATHAAAFRLLKAALEQAPAAGPAPTPREDLTP